MVVPESTKEAQGAHYSAIAGETLQVIESEKSLS
jgi:hypothetical protein